jgi:hypothetical protein
VIQAAYGQLECANGVADTPYVTMRLTVNGETQGVEVDAFQVSKLCMEMVAEGALDADSEHAGSSAVHPSFTAVLEGKPATLVDNSMFLCNVAVKQHKSEQLVNLFPPANREGTMQTKGDVKAQLERAGSSGYSFVDLLADFHLLLFLDADPFFDKETFMAGVARCVTDRAVALDEGHVLLLRAWCGMDTNDYMES